MYKVPQKFFCFGYRTITLIKPDIRVGEAVISWNLHFVHIHLSHKAFVKTEYIRLENNLPLLMQTIQAQACQISMLLVCRYPHIRHRGSCPTQYVMMGQLLKQ